MAFTIIFYLSSGIKIPSDIKYTVSCLIGTLWKHSIPSALELATIYFRNSHNSFGSLDDS
jgi:hypothetical protein